MSDLNNMDIDKWCKDAIAKGGRGGRLEWATANGLTETVVTIIEQNNIDINEEHGDERYTLLHIAAINNYSDTANALIKKGADPDAQDKDGKTPLHCAIELHRSSEMIRSLIKGKANVNVKDKDGKTPLDLATDDKIKTLLQPTEKSDPVDESSTDSKGGQEGDAQTEEQQSSFFGSLFSILMKPFSLIGSFFGGFFSWLFGSDEPTQSLPESDQPVVLEPPGNSGDNDIM